MSGEDRPWAGDSPAGTWGTVRTRRSVLAVARNMTSAGRLLDVLPMFGSDLRVRTLFTTVEGSAFDDGLDVYLRAAGARTIPWAQAVATRFDLALSASANGDLHRIDAPLLLMPHGAGHNRLLRTGNGYGPEVSGLARSQLVRDGRVVPAAIALSHQEQLGRLARYCPEAVTVATVTGDPSFDRLVAHLPRRRRYRRALGVPDGLRLVLVSSTWGEHSLYGANGDVLPRLLAELPLDEYRVALVTHPNIPLHHGELQLRLWLARERSAGLTVIPPERGWQAALIASDVVVGDHGSVTFYGAALGRPVLLASSGREAQELDPSSPTAELCGVLPRLDRRRGLLEQVEEALSAHVPGAYDRVTGRTLGNLGRAGESLREVAYRLMDLAHPPGSAPGVPFAEPYGAQPAPASFLVETWAGEDGAVTMRRFPAAVTRPLDGEPRETHLTVDAEELNRRLLESAAVIVHRDGSPEWAREAVRRHPGCALAAAVVDGRRVHVVLRRDGREFVLGLPETSQVTDLSCLPSALYGWLVSERRAGEPPSVLRLRLGAVEGRVEVTPVRP
ncbi:translation initiation factor IF-2 [Streptosporangium sp. NPDC020072]|uniref:translation initiation factor IF-2 n=1 Tax=Streptosporangium sp. NPDC020072 TaxID=3154788 RepID=UPI00343753A5